MKSAAAGNSAHHPSLGTAVRFAGESYGVLARNFGAFLLIAAPWAVLVAAAWNLLESGYAVFAAFLLLAAGGSSVAVGLHRILLLGETPLQAMRPRFAILKFAGLGIFAFLAGAFTAAFLSWLARAAGLPAQSEAIEDALLWLAFLWFLSLRLMAFPALSIEDPRITLRQALRARVTAAEVWIVYAGTLVATIPAELVNIIVVRHLPGETLGAHVIRSGVGAIFVFAMIALIAGYSTALYRWLETPEGQPGAARASGKS
jgi:hypothetical protein